MIRLVINVLFVLEYGSINVYTVHTKFEPGPVDTVAQRHRPPNTVD